LNNVDLSELWRFSFEYFCVSDSNKFELFTILADDGAVHRFESCVNRGLSNQQLLKKTKLDKMLKMLKSNTYSFQGVGKLNLQVFIGSQATNSFDFSELVRFFKFKSGSGQNT